MLFNTYGQNIAFIGLEVEHLQSSDKKSRRRFIDVSSA